MQLQSILDRLGNPPNSYRPIPFWSWNERLNTEETRRQIAEMHHTGIGGYFMHARGGLQTPYMGDEWMDNIAAGIDEARQRDMGAWVYDENGWPSGFGDGLVNGRGIAYQQKYLRIEQVASRDDASNERLIALVPNPAGGFFRLFYDINPFYIDVLDRAVVGTFLQEIHQRYVEQFPDDIGKAMPGFFTDEPQVSRNGIPWSFTMPEQYREAYGEDLLPLLPQLFHNVDNYERTRYRFWHLVQELFVTNFTQQIYDWCEAHHSQLTGHMVLEETLLSQLTSNGAVMPNYEFFHKPGIDWLGRHIDPSTTPIQAASVAHQLGKKQLLSETFALTGWNVHFNELKWMFEWQCARGVTQMCQHLEGYSLRGISKRDYPPSHFFQQPFWEHYRLFNDTMSRLGMMLSEGDVCFDLLVIHPQSSAWLCYDDATNEGIKNLETAFMGLTETLEAAHIPFHYGDERILARHGKVLDGKLHVGTQAYTTVVVPPTLTLAAGTVALLQDFAHAGGTIIWQGMAPKYVEGESSDLLQPLTAQGQHVTSAEEVISRIPAAVRRIPVCTTDGKEIGPIAATWRQFQLAGSGQTAQFYFFANADTEQSYQATIRIPGKSVAWLSLETGCLLEIPARQAGDDLLVEHTFDARGSLALLASATPDAFVTTKSQALTVPTGHQAITVDDAEPWQVTLLDPNALTLDM
ncbi:MAG TPA: glycosyl hydrolase, partial [Armatimonadota bacterium]|nr:glycosyl hydrolase [Armatimonadota bacterium]